MLDLSFIEVRPTPLRLRGAELRGAYSRVIWTVKSIVEYTVSRPARGREKHPPRQLKLRGLNPTAGLITSSPSSDWVRAACV